MRDPNGRFAKANNHLESESVSVFDCEPLRCVIDAWNAQRFEFKLARAGRSPRVFMRTHHPNRSASFTRISNPTPLNLSTPSNKVLAKLRCLGWRATSTSGALRYRRRTTATHPAERSSTL